MTKSRKIMNEEEKGEVEGKARESEERKSERERERENREPMKEQIAIAQLKAERFKVVDGRHGVA
jgi:hypothetical protein